MTPIREFYHCPHCQRRCPCGKSNEAVVEQPSDTSIRHIALTRGQVAIVDAADYDWLNQWKWSAEYATNTKSFYARRYVWRSDEKRLRISMHRALLGLEDGDPRFGDHVNGNTVDNRRANLRAVTPAQNNMNCKMNTRNTSGYRGVTFNKKQGWRAQIKANGKQIYLGSFPTPELAYIAYCEAASKHFGEFARTT